MASSARYLIFIEKPSVMPDGKTPDANYLVAFMLNNFPPQIRGNFEHHILDASNYQEWKSRIPQLVTSTPQLIDAANGQVIHGIQCMFFLYKIIFQANSSFMLSSLSPNLQQLDYQFRSQLMPPPPTSSSSSSSSFVGGMTESQKAQMMRQQARQPIQSSRNQQQQIPAKPSGTNGKESQLMSNNRNSPQVSGASYGSGMGSGMGGGMGSGMGSGMGGGMGGGSTPPPQAAAAAARNDKFLNIASIPDSTANLSGSDMNSYGYTVHRDMLHYNLPKNAEIPKELETYLNGSENPDVSGLDDSTYQGLPSTFEDRCGFLGVMEMGPTQLIDKSVNTYEDYNEVPEYLDIASLNISNAPINSQGMKESYDPQAIKEARRNQGGGASARRV